MKGLCKLALVALVGAACGGDVGITEPVAPEPPPASGGILALGVDSTTGASIETNKDDYSPGEIVHLVGQGWAPNETVNLQMTEDPNTHADVDTNVVADAAGGFSIHFYDVQVHDLGVTFTLTATGQTSRSVAVATFTDGTANLDVAPAWYATNPGSVRFSVLVRVTAAPANARQCLKLSVPSGYTNVSLVSFQVGVPGWASATSSPSANTIRLSGATGLTPGAADAWARLEVDATPPVAAGTTSWAGQLGNTTSGTLDCNGALNTDNAVIRVGATLPRTFLATFRDAGGAVISETATPGVNKVFRLRIENTSGGSGDDARYATIAVPSCWSSPNIVNVTTSSINGAFSATVTDNYIRLLGGQLVKEKNPDEHIQVEFTATPASGCSSTFRTTLWKENEHHNTPSDLSQIFSHQGVHPAVTLGSANVAPTVDAGGPYSVAEGSAIPLGSASASDADAADVLAYKWTVNKAGIDAGGNCTFSPSDVVLNPSVTCTDDSQGAAGGKFTLSLEVKDGAGGHTVTDNADLTVTNAKPTANANGPYGGNVNTAIPLTGTGADAGTNDVLSYSWSVSNAGIGTCTFAPGNTSQSPTVSCTLPSAGAPGGVFKLSLTVSDDDGLTSDVSQADLTITNQAPSSSTGAPAGGYTGNEGSPITITGSGADPDGGTVSFLWSVAPDDGKCSFGNASSASTTVTCTDNGAWTLSLKVTDDETAFTTSTGALNVANVAPTIGSNTLGTTVNEGSSIPFSVGNVTDPSSVDQTTGFTYAFKCGSASYSDFGTSTLTNCPAGDGPGSVVIKGKARDKDGGISDEVESTFTVVNVKPTIIAVNTNSPVNEGSDATLTVTTVTDPWAGDLVGAQYAFACDGITYGDWGSSNSVNCPTTDGPASFTIRARVKDKDGAESDPFAQNITVANVAPTVTGVTAPSSVDEGPGTFAFSATGVTDPSATDAAAGFQYAFSCNNGSTWSTYSTTNSSTCAAPDGPATIVVAVKAKDKDDGESVPVTKSVTVNNLEPTVTGVTAPASVNEGPSFNFSASGVTDPSPVDQAGVFQYAFSCNNGSTWSAFSTTNSGTCAAPDGPATINVAVKAKDKDGAESDPETASVTVNNVAPELNLGATTAMLSEGGTFSRGVSFTDPGADTWSATVNYGDGGGEQPLALNPDKTFSLSHVYPQDGTFTITVAIDDDEEDSDSETITVTVNNVLPLVGAFAGASMNEGGSYSTSGSFTDPGADTWTATVNYGDGTGPQVLALSGKNFTLNHTYADDDGSPFTVTVSVNDDDGPGSSQATVIVLNVAPVITTPLVLPASPVAMGSNFSMSWTFTDPGSDSWKCRISWDQPVAYGPPFNSSGNTCSISGASLPAGVYTVTVYVEDDDTGSDEETATSSYIVVYDPNGGFVTGGGWINSPAGAYPADVSMTGKANFGFVSKYQPGRTVPQGNTEFQFHTGNLNFKSTVYEWLVVAGDRAQFKGDGSINGVGGYGFLLTALDGSPDKFRIKIVNKASGAVVYDNQMGEIDDSPAATIISGGSIVVHNKK